MPRTEFEGHLVLFHMKSDPFCKLPISKTVKLELLDGKVFAISWPPTRKQYFVLQLAAAVHQWAHPRQLGYIFPDTLVKLDDEWVPAPDFVFVVRRRRKQVKKYRIEGPVDLVVEVIHPHSPEIDRQIKFDGYARYGVEWYWIVDRRRRLLEEYQRVGDRFGNLVRVPYDKPFKPRLFKGLTIDLASLEW